MILFICWERPNHVSKFQIAEFGGGGGRERMAVDLYEAFRKFRFLDEVNNDNTIAKALFCNNFSSIFNKK